MFIRALETNSEAHLKDYFLTARRTLYWIRHSPGLEMLTDRLRYIWRDHLSVINQRNERKPTSLDRSGRENIQNNTFISSIPTSRDKSVVISQ